MLKILLVEDNEMNRDMLSPRLERKGHTVLDGWEANRFTQRASSDIEGRYRVTFYAENQPVTPVIVITARDLTDDDRRRLNGEVARILQKGANSIDDLFAEIRSLIPNQA